MKTIKSLFTFIFLLLTFSSFSQWQWQNPYPQPNSLTDIFFIDEGIGWAVGENGTIIKLSMVVKPGKLLIVLLTNI